MSKLRLVLAAVFVIAQFPFGVFAAAAPAGPVEVPTSLLATLTGGVCSNCSTDPDPDPEPPRRVGSAYWEHTDSRQVSFTRPGGQLVFQHNNRTHLNQRHTFQYTQRESFNWSVSGGIPANIVRGSIGRTYDNTSTVTAEVTVPARYSYKRYVTYPTTRYHYTFTRWQDWSDGSRERLSTGTVAASKVHTEETSILNPL